MDTGDRTLRIVYASQTGTARDVAMFVAREAGRHHFVPIVDDVASVAAGELAAPGAPPVVWFVATTGQGEMPTASRALWRILLRKSLPPTALANMSYALFALGDSGYALFNAAGRKLDRRLAQLGAHALVPRGEGDDQHTLGLDGALHPWLDALWGALLAAHPLPPGKVVLSRDALGMPPPMYHVSFAASPAAASAEAAAAEDGSVPGPLCAALKVPSSAWRAARVVANERLTEPDHWQDVRGIQFELDAPADYVPGDVLNVLPCNATELVDELLEHLGLDSDPDAVLTLTANEAHPLVAAASSATGRAAMAPLAGLTTSVRALFTRVLDITSSPRRVFFELAPWHASEPREAERLGEFSSPEGQADLYDYNFRDARTVAEVLQDFPSLRPPLEYLLDMLPVLQPRAYSVSSAPAESRTAVGVTVAVVEYMTKIKTRPRRGLATTFMADSGPGAVLPVYLSAGGLRMPTDSAVPMVMIGPGTGVAPFMAFLQTVAAAATLPPTRHLLITGNRSSTADYLYKDTLAQWEVAGLVEVVYAASRESTPRTYVQDRIREPAVAARLWALVHDAGGVIYICGSAKKMPAAVKAAIRDLAESQGGMDSDAAAAWFKSLVKARRVVEDTWM